MGARPPGRFRGHRCRARPDDQLRHRLRLGRVELLTAGQPQHHACRHPAHPAERPAHRGQGQRRPAHLRQVVEAGHAHLLRHPSPRLRSASIAPRAIWSLEAKTAVGGSASRSSAWTATATEAWEKSPARRGCHRPVSRYLPARPGSRPAAPSCTAVGSPRQKTRSIRAAAYPAPVAVLPQEDLDPRPGLVGHVRTVVDHARHRRDGDSRLPGDLGGGHSAARGALSQLLASVDALPPWQYRSDALSKLCRNLPGNRR
jgi:hypothetical protein